MARYILETSDGSFQVREFEVKYGSGAKNGRNQDITVFHGSLNKTLAPEYGMGKSKLAYARLRHLEVSEVDFEQYHAQFTRRDEESRRRMRELINSPDNDLSQTIESII